MYRFRDMLYQNFIIFSVHFLSVQASATFSYKIKSGDDIFVCIIRLKCPTMLYNDSTLFSFLLLYKRLISILLLCTYSIIFHSGIQSLLLPITRISRSSVQLLSRIIPKILLKPTHDASITFISPICVLSISSHIHRYLVFCMSSTPQSSYVALCFIPKQVYQAFFYLLLLSLDRLQIVKQRL